MKRQIKLIRRAAARYSLFFFVRLVQILPFGVVRGVMRGVISVAFMFMGRLKKTALETLEIALSREKTGAERRKIMKACFENMKLGMIELIYFCRYPRRAVEHITAIDGKEHLDEALAQGKGVVFLTGHFGNFPVMMLSLAQAGYDVNCILRRFRDEKVREFVYDLMQSTGVKTIYTLPRRQCIADSLKVLKNNELLFVLLDQNFGAGTGVYVEFFGRKAATATGPFNFVERTGSAVLPIFNIRENRDSHRIIIEPPLKLAQTGDKNADMEENVARFTRVMERYVRAYPDEWGWMHHRWKTKDKGGA